MKFGTRAESCPRQRDSRVASALRSLNGYIRYVRDQQQGHMEYGDSACAEEGPVYTMIPDLPSES